MRAVCTLLVLVLLSCMVGGTQAASAAKKKKNYVQGYVVAVQNDGASGGSITVRLKPKKKQASTTATAVEKTFKVTTNTKFSVIAGKKGAVEEQAGDFTKVHKGGQVVLFHNGEEATEVKVLKKKTKAKKTNL